MGKSGNIIDDEGNKKSLKDIIPLVSTTVPTPLSVGAGLLGSLINTITGSGEDKDTRRKNIDQKKGR
jgi:hypothetical protein